MAGRPRGSDGTELLDIARESFLAEGFAGTTMDAIATRARISKSSLYRDHPSKDALYAAVVADWVRRGRDAMRPHVEQLLAADDPAAGLLQFARALQNGILSTPVLRMRALVAAESQRFPDVGRAYVEQSWNRNMRMLADAIAELQRRNVLRPADPLTAAQQFTWLAIAEPLNEWELLGENRDTDPVRLARLAESAVAMFVARYGSS